MQETEADVLWQNRLTATDDGFHWFDIKLFLHRHSRSSAASQNILVSSFTFRPIYLTFYKGGSINNFYYLGHVKPFYDADDDDLDCYTVSGIKIDPLDIVQ